jgi:predicted DNA-binding protein (MmcQ/YjbR family)
MPRTSPTHDDARQALRAFGLRYPRAHLKSPWPGHLDLAVNDKTFAFLNVDGEPFRMSCKLPRSAEAALSLPHTAPTPYGLGRSGWVSVTLPAGAAVPVELFQAWIDESYRAQAPKRLIAQLDASPVRQPASAAAGTRAKRPRTRTAPRKSRGK